MRRKLVKQAGQAVTITLPIEWVRDNGLKAGDEVDVDMNEKDLIIRSGKKTVGGSVQISLPDVPPRIVYYYLNSLYAKGVDEIELVCDNADALTSLEQNMGFAVVCQKHNKHIIHDVGGMTSENMDVIFKRVFQMIIGFYDRAIEDMFGERKETFATLSRLDGEINKFALFLQRSIMKQMYADPKGGKILFAYSYALEKIGDEIVRAWRTSIKYGPKVDDDMRKIFDISRRALQTSFEAYYQYSLDKVKDLINIKSNIRKHGQAMSNMDYGRAHLVMQAIKIAEDAGDLIHLALMKNLDP